MTATMRAKMLLETITTARSQYSQESIPEVLKFRAVAKNGSYPSDGSDEDNTYAKFSPTASVEITIANPELIGKFNPGEFYYVDFTPTN